jgi:hypothetical protein
MLIDRVRECLAETATFREQFDRKHATALTVAQARMEAVWAWLSCELVSLESYEEASCLVEVNELPGRNTFRVMYRDSLALLGSLGIVHQEVVFGRLPVVNLHLSSPQRNLQRDFDCSASYSFDPGEIPDWLSHELAVTFALIDKYPCTSTVR